MPPKCTLKSQFVKQPFHFRSHFRSHFPCRGNMISQAWPPLRAQDAPPSALTLSWQYSQQPKNNSASFPPNHQEATTTTQYYIRPYFDPSIHEALSHANPGTTSALLIWGSLQLAYVLGYTSIMAARKRKSPHAACHKRPAYLHQQ